MRWLMLVALMGCAPRIEGLGVAEDGVYPSERRIFVTAQDFESGFLNRREGGNAFCNSQARLAGLKKDYRAIVGHSDEGALGAPSKRFTGLDPVYLVCGGRRVLAGVSVSALWNPPIAHPVQCDQYGVNVGTRRVWTGTLSDGSSAASNCLQWLNNLSIMFAVTGLTNAVSGVWIHDVGNDLPCDESAALYCLSE